jgi:Emfourin
VRARPQRIVIERGGGPGGETLRAEIDPANMPADVAGAISQLLDETRSPASDDEPGDNAYDVVLDYGDHSERLRYDEDELPEPTREALDARLEHDA